ncbi:MAG TPA: alpha-1,6-glucosidase domain-containing protein, partial [Lysobacter sp.]|nr:alpha-1,6-glucosidase domain-containing protein [Lysobacter sp.]
NTGPEQNPLVIAGHLEGTGYDGANFREVLYLLNGAPQAQTVVLPEEAGKRYALHPVLADAQAADSRAKQTTFDPRTGHFVVPARTATVFVVE